MASLDALIGEFETAKREIDPLLERFSSVRIPLVVATRGHVKGTGFFYTSYKGKQQLFNYRSSDNDPRERQYSGPFKASAEVILGQLAVVKDVTDAQAIEEAISSLKAWKQMLAATAKYQERVPRPYAILAIKE